MSERLTEIATAVLTLNGAVGGWGVLFCWMALVLAFATAVRQINVIIQMTDPQTRKQTGTYTYTGARGLIDLSLCASRMAIGLVLFSLYDVQVPTFIVLLAASALIEIPAMIFNVLRMDKIIYWAGGRKLHLTAGLVSGLSLVLAAVAAS